MKRDKIKAGRLPALLISAVLLLCSCGSGETDVQQPYKEREPFTPTGETVESAIFGNEVEYNSFSPAENAVLPVDSADISGMAQIEKTLFLLADGAVYSFNAETGESGRLFDTDAEILAADGTSVYTYAPGSGSLLAYSPSGELMSDDIIEIEAEDLEVTGLYVTDSYYSFVCLDKSTGIHVTQHIVYDRETLEIANTVSESKSYISASGYRIFGRYKGDSILKVESDSSDGRFVNIFETDLTTGKSKKLNSVEISAQGSVIAFSYRERSDTLLIFAAPDSEGDFAPFLTECSISDPDNLLLRRYYTDAPCTGAFLAAYENVVCIITSPGGCMFYDSLDPPKSITLACSIAGKYGDIIANFEQETGITVRTVSYGLDFQRLDIKLMAGDDDFDIFEPIPMHRTKYFLAGMYEDLSGYEGLKKRLDGSAAAGYVASLDGQYIGIPTGISNFTDRANFEDTAFYSQTVSSYLYLAQNVSLPEGRFDDPDGEKLYKLLKFIYDNPDGNESKMPFGKDLCLLDSDFLIMNPNGKNKEDAARFLEFVFDSVSGGYTDVGTDGDVYVMWRCFSPDYTNPILEACNKVKLCDGKNSSIKELAREAASQVQMRISE